MSHKCYINLPVLSPGTDVRMLTVHSATGHKLQHVIHLCQTPLSYVNTLQKI